MSITSRINEMSSHIEQAYDELQGLGADLTNINKNIENISMVLDDIYDSMPQVSGEGTSLTLDDTRVGKIKSTLKGNTSQSGTPTPSSPIPVNVVSGDNYINVEGTNLLKKQGYGTPNNDSDYWVGSPTWLTSGDNGWATFTLDNSSSSSVAYKNMMIKGGNVNYLPSTNYTIFVELDDLSLDNATGDMLYLSQGGNAQDPFNSGQKLITYAQAPNKVFKFNVTTKADLTNTIAFRTFAVVPAGKNVSYKIRAMIVKGTYTSDTYEPYQNNSYDIDLGDIELCKIGNYQDYFYKDSGKWYLHKEIGKVVLNGSESWIFRTDWIITNASVFRNNDYVVGTFNTGTLGYSNYLEVIENVPSSSTNYRYIRVTNSSGFGTQLFIQNDYLGITSEDTTTQKAEKLKNWLINHNVIIYGIKPTPTNTEITYQPLIDQLNELEKAMSKQGQTNISQVNNDLPFIISASALKEWQESTSLNSTLSMVNPLSLGNTLNTQENDIQPIEVDNIEPLEEEENEES